MKMTVEKFDEMINKEKSEIESMRAEISRLLQREAELNAEMNAAAESGNVELFKAKKAEKDDVSASIYVKRSCLDKAKGTDHRAEAVEAWNTFAAEYNKKLKNALADIGKQKERLCSLYSDAVDLQNAALTIRERLADAVGMDSKTKFNMDFIPCAAGIEAFGLLSLSGVSVKDPDAVYYLSCYSQRNQKRLVAYSEVEPEVDRIFKVVAAHHSF